MTLWLIWILIASALILLEIFTLSLYLLLAAFGALVAAFLAFIAYSATHQILAAAFVTLAGWILLSKYRPRHQYLDSRENPDLNMDIGAIVRVTGINANNNTLIVPLRGANWEAELADANAQPDLTRDYKIVRIDGARLILKPKEI